MWTWLNTKCCPQQIGDPNNVDDALDPKNLNKEQEHLLKVSTLIRIDGLSSCHDWMIRLWKWAIWLSVPGWWHHGWRWSLAMPVFPSISTVTRIPILAWWDLVLLRFCCQTNSNLQKRSEVWGVNSRFLVKGSRFLMSAYSTENQSDSKNLLNNKSKRWLEVLICWASHGSDCHLCHHRG